MQNLTCDTKNEPLYIACTQKIRAKMDMVDFKIELMSLVHAQKHDQKTKSK